MSVHADSDSAGRLRQAPPVASLVHHDECNQLSCTLSGEVHTPPPAGKSLWPVPTQIAAARCRLPQVGGTHRAWGWRRVHRRPQVPVSLSFVAPAWAVYASVVSGMVRPAAKLSTPRSSCNEVRASDSCTHVAPVTSADTCSNCAPACSCSCCCCCHVTHVAHPSIIHAQVPGSV